MRGKATQGGRLGKAFRHCCLAGALLLVFGGAPVLAQDDVRYRWEPVFYGKLEGKEVLLYNDSAYHGKLTFGDNDGDGDLDLVLGKSDGRLSWFENQGQPGLPRWVLKVEQLTTISNTPGSDGVVRTLRRIIDLGSFAAPSMVDIDQDGDLDLIVGTAKGRVFLYRNTGTDVLPTFELAREDFVAPNFGQRVVPFLADVDGDRDYDLFLGNEQGSVFLLPNIGNQSRPAFCSQFPSPNARPGTPPPCYPTPQRLTDQNHDTHASPALTDWDGDGDLDLFVGWRDGTISYYRNHGSPYVPSWRLFQRRFLAIDNGGFAAPAFVDTNGDGHPDLLAGTSTNRVFLYTNKDTGRLLDVWKVTDNLLQVQRIGEGRQRVIVASGDLDGDKDLDLIVGDRSGGLRWMENVGSPSSPAWRTKQGNLFEGVSRKNTAPVLVDMDKDGDLDILVGGEEGRLWLVRNDGTPKAPHWNLADNFFGGIDVGSASVPAVHDIDQDGDLDLFVGNARGLVIFYRNEGGNGGNAYKLVSTRFAGTSVGRNATPTFFDWNRDKKADLFVGNRNGKLTLTANGNPEKDTVLRSWTLKSRFWNFLQVKGFSAPHFNDFNGDGEQDLMVGDGEGNLLLWINRGFVKIPSKEETAKQPPAAAAGTSNQALSAETGMAAAPTSELPARNSLAGSLSQALGPQAPIGPILPEFVLANRAFGNLNFKGKAVPDFLDMDGDGDLDMVVGTGKGLLIHFRNDGTVKKPQWSRVTDSFSGYKHGRNASPLFVDLDGDEQKDLVVGTEFGRLLLFKNVGTEGAAKFNLLKDTFSTINVGRNAAPALILEKKTHRWQLLVGNFAGRLVGYNQIDSKNPFNFKKTHRQFLGLDMGISSTPYFGDLDRDGELDLIVGSDQGNLLNFKMIAPTVKNPWGWQRGPDYFRGLKFPVGSTPRLADIDGDGDPDLFVGTEAGLINFFRNDAITEEGAGRQ